MLSTNGHLRDHLFYPLNLSVTAIRKWWPEGIFYNQKEKLKTQALWFLQRKSRSDATLNLINAIAGQTSKESVVKLSLNQLFRRDYSSITDVLDNLFRIKALVNPLTYLPKRKLRG